MDGSAFVSLTPEDQAKAYKRVLDMAARARLDPAVFITACARTEKQTGVVLSAHQRLLLAFVTRYRMSVVRMPRGASKTFLMTFLGMWYLGRDRAQSGLIVSAEVGQAKQPLMFTKDYIERGDLGLVFPELRRSSDPKAPWRDDRIVVDRPPGIRTPSIRASGIGGKLYGNRLHWAIIDDILTQENTNTAEQRDKIASAVETNILGALDIRAGRCVMTNTPWNRDDATYRFEKRWPSISMSVDGFIKFGKLSDAEVEREFGAFVRKSRTRPGRWRLKAHDPDPNEVLSIWPQQWTPDDVEMLRSTWTPFNFARSFLCEPFDEGSARCLREWTDGAFELGAGLLFPLKRTGKQPTYTGVDIGGVKKGHDNSAICTIELLDDGRRRLLNLQSGLWHGPELVKRIAAEALAFDSTVYVESNGAQKFIADFAAQESRGLRVHKFDTGRNKYDETFGVEAVFTELMRNQWIWPDGAGTKHPEVLDKLADACVFYNPADHTPDELMALFLARQGLANHYTVGRQGAVGAPRIALKGGGF